MVLTIALIFAIAALVGAANYVQKLRRKLAAAYARIATQQDNVNLATEERDKYRMERDIAKGNVRRLHQELRAAETARDKARENEAFRVSAARELEQRLTGAEQDSDTWKEKAFANGDTIAALRQELARANGLIRAETRRSERLEARVRKLTDERASLEEIVTLMIVEDRALPASERSHQGINLRGAIDAAKGHDNLERHYRSGRLSRAQVEEILVTKVFPHS